MAKIIKNYSSFRDDSIDSMFLLIQHWGNGGPSACIKSAYLLISDEPIPFVPVTSISYTGATSGKVGQGINLSATVAPENASKQKITWSIAGFQPEGSKTWLTDTTKYVSKQTNSTIVATEGGKVKVKATILGGRGNNTDFVSSDFIIDITSPIPYIVPASGAGFFYVNLNDWATQTPEWANINSTVPLAVTAANKITVPFTENNQRVNFGFTADQIAILQGLKDAGGSVDVKIVGTVTSGSGDSFRYHIGNALMGSNWNGTNGKGADTFANILTSTQTFTTNADTLGYFILQHRTADAATIEIYSIKITYTSAPAGQQINVTFGVDATEVVREMSDGTEPGIIAYANGGYTYTYGTVENSNYGNAIVRFKVDLGTATLGQYSKVTFTWTGISGDVASNRKLYLLATDTEEDITPYKSDNAIKALVVNTSIFDNGPPTNFWGDTGAPSVNGTDPTPVEMNILVHGDLTGEVWFAIYTHASGGAYTISDFKLVP